MDSIAGFLIRKLELVGFHIGIHDHGVIRFPSDFDADFFRYGRFGKIRRIDLVPCYGAGLETVRRKRGLPVSEGRSGDHEHRYVSDDRRRSLVGHRSRTGLKNGKSAYCLISAYAFIIVNYPKEFRPNLKYALFSVYSAGIPIRTFFVLAWIFSFPGHSPGLTHGF